MEVVARPSFDLAGPQVSTFAFNTQGSKTLPDVAVDVEELVRRIARAEVVPPSAQHRIDMGDHLANVIMTPCSWSQLLHALPDSLHAALRWPSLEEVHAPALLLPDWSTQPFPQVT